MQFPRIHINGTAPQDLLKAITEALHALDTAMAKLRETSPHGRDYYPIGADAASTAFKEHTARCEALRKVYVELQAMGEHIANQMAERRQTRGLT